LKKLILKLKKRALLLSVSLNLAFLVGLFALVKIKGGFDYLWIKSSSLIRGQGFDRNYSPHYFERKEYFARMPKQPNDVLFIGDSLVEYCEWSKLLEDSDILNRGILGDDTLGVLHRIEETIQPIPPRRMILMVGINDLFQGVSEKLILSNYEDILAEIEAHAPNSEVIVNGLLPIDLRRAPKPIPPDRIRSLNTQLQQLCHDYKVQFLHTFPSFEDKDGLLDDQYSRDGLHLNAKGYQVWKRLLENLKGI
tara:strand:+ start:721 stop:1473 length:753 start_codon:yes stop_codon:yes gene_type:complete